MRNIVIDNIRIISTIAIVLLHCFAIYTGAWKEPQDFSPVRAYSILGLFFSSFAVPTFVFISGFLFERQIQSNTINSLSKLIVNKFKRLYFPAIVFGMLYTLLFLKIDFESLLRVFNGVAHLWFLPMLFWCFILAFILRKRVSFTFLIFLSLVLVFIGGGYLPFGVSRMFLCFAYFVFGMVCYRGEIGFNLKINYIQSLILFVITFVVYVYGNKFIKEHTDSFNLITDLAISRAFVFFRVLVGLIGCYTLYLICNKIKLNTQSNLINTFLSSSFGIYIYHQFFLQILYYKTNYPSYINPILLPWITFILVLVLSYFSTRLTVSTKLGRKIL